MVSRGSGEALATSTGAGTVCLPAFSAWEEPNPEILIQGRNRTGFSTGSA